MRVRSGIGTGIGIRPGAGTGVRPGVGAGAGAEVSAGGRSAQGLLPRSGRVQRAVHETGETDRDACAADRAEADLGALPGPKRTDEPAGTASRIP